LYAEDLHGIRAGGMVSGAVSGCSGWFYADSV
jgi:hypothetical protein